LLGELFDKNDQKYIGATNILADINLKLKDYPAAWAAINENLEILTKGSLSADINIDQKWKEKLEQSEFASKLHLIEMIKTLGVIYELLQADDRIDATQNKQILVADLAAVLLKKFRDSQSNDEDKLKVLAQSSDWLRRSLIHLDPKKSIDKAFELAEQNKSVLLLQSYSATRNYQLGDLPEALIKTEKDYIEERDALQAALLENRPELEQDSLRTSLIQVNQELLAFTEKLKKDYPKYAKLKYDQVSSNIEDIQNQLTEEMALIEYVLADSIVYIFYIEKNQKRLVSSTFDKKELSQNIRDLHETLSNYSLLNKDPKASYQNYTKLAHWFYQKLLAPILSKDSKIKDLIIVTDGELGHLPFEAFLVEAAPTTETSYTALHYLLNDFKLSYNYSATLWKENRESTKPKNNGQILAMAANYVVKVDIVDNTTRLPSDQMLRSVLQPLPAARQEVEALAKNFKGFFGFDNQATERIFKEKAATYAVIHLAMHGLLDSKRPVLSSLAFTEDGDPTETNFLQAHEISKMTLNAELVVLSACETGYGKFEAGNGIASLARAFMYAGSSALVVSLWQVNDAATAEVMKRFYNNLATGMKKDEALQQAKLDYIRSVGSSSKTADIAAHPAFWSPFVLIGSTDSVKISKKGGNPYYLGAIVGTAAGLLGFGLLWRRRKGKRVEG
jgi:CHAT domain-containing protein